MKTEKTITGNVDPDVLCYTVGDDPVLDLDLAVWDCLGTAAHVTMLSEIPVSPSIVTKEEAKLVKTELAKIIASAEKGDFTIEESDQDVHIVMARRQIAVTSVMKRRRGAVVMFVVQAVRSVWEREM
jgi:argininosuccinate lyase